MTAEASRVIERVRQATQGWPEQRRAQIESATRITPHVFQRIIEGKLIGEALEEALVEQMDLALRSPDWGSRYQDLVASDEHCRGRVLDIGSGGQFPFAMRFLSACAAQVDGVEPGPAVASHPGLTLRWQDEFEKAPIPETTYDLAYALNVLEHIREARPFFEKLSRVLRPGGTFWGHTPHSRHPFAYLSRGLELAGFKGTIARNVDGVNDYPAYYRLNSKRQICKAIEGLGFEEPTFEYHASPGWYRGYFPRLLQWAPAMYDRMLGEPVASLRLLMIVRLRRAER